MQCLIRAYTTIYLHIIINYKQLCISETSTGYSAKAFYHIKSVPGILVRQSTHVTQWLEASSMASSLDQSHKRNFILRSSEP